MPVRGGTGAPPRRILMTADTVGGVWTYALDLAAGLAARGVGTVLAVLGPAPDPRQRAAAEAAAPGLVLRQLDAPLDWLAAAPEAVEEAGAAVAALAAREPGIELVHLNTPALAAAARFPVPVVGACHSCVATWWRAVRGMVTMPEDFLWRTALTWRGLAAAQVLVAPTHAFACATAATYRLRHPPRTVHNGRRPAGRAPSGPPQAAFAFTAGRLWDEGKDLATLDRAAARLAVPILAAGPVEGPHGGRVALPHLRLLGTLPPSGVAHWLAQGPVFVSMAIYEPFGLAVLEAAQAGCALVLADTPGFRELWDGAAAFVPPGDDAALAAALAALFADPSRRAQLGRAAAERSRRYGVEAMTEGMLAAYAAALQGAPLLRTRREMVA